MQGEADETERLRTLE